MSTDLTGLLGLLPAIWDVFQESWVFAFIKWFLIVYTVVLLVDVVLLLMLRGVVDNLKVSLYGTTRPLLSKNKALERWQGIEQRLQSDNPSQYKVAILEADQFADALLAESGYAGSNMGERLASVHPGQIASYESLKAAHEVRNRIVREQNFAVSREEAKVLLDQYKQFFIELELLA